MRGIVLRLMLSVCLLPLVSSLNGAIRAIGGALSPGVTTVTVMIVDDTATVAVLILAYVYWTAIWFGVVQWTPQRRKRTGLAMLCSLLTGIGVVTLCTWAINTQMMEQHWYSPAIIQDSQAPAIAVWLLGTTLVWRETADERRLRTRPAGPRLMGAVHCPKCTYNMTGLSVTRCPECGTQYTIETLLAANLEDADLDHTSGVRRASAP